MKLQSIGPDSISRTTPDRRRAEGKWRMSRFPLSQPPSPWSHFANYLESALNRSSSSLSTLLYTPRARIRHETRVRAPVDNRTYPSTAILFQYYAQLPPPTFPPSARRGRRKVSTVSLHRPRPNNYCLGESQPRGNASSKLLSKTSIPHRQ